MSEVLTKVKSNKVRLLLGPLFLVACGNTGNEAEVKNCPVDMKQTVELTDGSLDENDPDVLLEFAESNEYDDLTADTGKIPFWREDDIDTLGELACTTKVDGVEVEFLLPQAEQLRADYIKIQQINADLRSEHKTIV